jgi:hypothetical protein
MRLLTEDAVVPCAHELGLVQNRPTQALVRIAGRRVLVETDPEGRSIRRCPNIGIGMKPCTTTLRVQKGYSSLLRVDGHRVCLDTVTGLTDGSPPGTVNYHVRSPGQGFVSEGGP